MRSFLFVQIFAVRGIYCTILIYPKLICPYLYCTILYYVTKTYGSVTKTHGSVTKTYGSVTETHGSVTENAIFRNRSVFCVKKRLFCFFFVQRKFDTMYTTTRRR